MTEHGLILLKPDGAASSGMRGRLAESLDRHGLRVAQRRRLRFSTDDIVLVWPMFGSAAHPVMRALYRHYMTSGDAEALLLHGPEALAGGLSVKAELRRDFEVCAFENALHAPADAQELAANTAFLFDGQARPPDAAWPDWSKRGCFGRAALLPPARIEAAAAAVWRDRVSGGWNAVRGAAASGGAWQATLRPGDPNSIDYGMAALFETLEGLSFEDCVRRYIAAEVFGGSVLATGSEAAMGAVRRDLALHRMTVELVRVDVADHLVG